MSNPITPADPDTLLPAARAFAAELRQKVDASQQGLPTFADQVWLAFITHLEHGGPIDGADEREALARLTALLSRREQGRYVDYVARAAATAAGTEVAYFDMITSQGATACLEWKGRP